MMRMPDYCPSTYSLLWARCRAVGCQLLCVYLAACGAQTDRAQPIYGLEKASARDEPVSAPDPGCQKFEPTPQNAAENTPGGCVRADEQPTGERYTTMPPTNGDSAQRPLATFLSSAVTLELTRATPASNEAFEVRVRCDGMRIAPHVILTAAHCFSWYRRVEAYGPPAAQVIVRSRDLNSETLQGELQTPALHVAIHPQYPALSCTQPGRLAAACLRAAGRCAMVYGRDTAGRSACLHNISQQVIEAQQGAMYDLALVFVAPSSQHVCDIPQACAVIAREPQKAVRRQLWLRQCGANNDAWRLDDTGFTASFALEPQNSSPTSFDLTPNRSSSTRLFDGAFGAEPSADTAVQLTAWAARAVLEYSVGDGQVPLRYTRLEPHLPWLLDTIASVSRSYPALPSDLPKIVEVSQERN